MQLWYVYDQKNRISSIPMLSFLHIFNATFQSSYVAPENFPELIDRLKKVD